MIHLRTLGICILENADQIIFLSNSYKKRTINNYVPKNLKKKILEKSIVIPNGIDKYWLENKGQIKKNSNKKKVNLLYVGVINKNKNIIGIIETMKLLVHKGINAKLTIVGRVADKSIYNQIKALDNVDYIKPKSKEELLDIYRINDIFVMPSIHESFGLVYAEAMSQGLPVIYTRGQGFDEQFKDGEIGYSVSPTDFDEISIKIIEINNNLEKMSKKSIESVDKFNWVEINENYRYIYNKIYL